MIFDQNLMFSDAQAVTATAISKNVLDFGQTGTIAYEAAAMARDLGAGNELPIAVMVNEAFNNLTSLTVTIETSDSADLSGSTVISTSGAIPLADLTAGKKIMPRVLPDGETKRYLGLRYTVTGTAPTAGKITAALGTEVGS